MKLIKLKLQGPSLVWAPQALIAGGCGEFQVKKVSQRLSKSYRKTVPLGKIP